MRRLYPLVGLILSFAAIAADTTPFTPYSQIYQFSATNSAGTAVQVTPNNPNFAGCVQYLLQNTGANDIWVSFATSQSASTPSIPSPGSPGTSTLVQAGQSKVITEFNNAWLNVQTGSGTSTLNASCGQGALYAGGSPATVTVTPSGTQNVNLTQTNSVTQLTGSGATGTGSERVTVATDSATIAGSAPNAGITVNAGTNLNTSALALETGGNLASIKTDVDNLNLAQGSTTSGQKGSLTLAAVSTSAPSYTNAQTSALSLTTAGLLRVDGTGGTFPVSGTVTATNAANGTTGSTTPTTATLIGGNDGTNLQGIKVDTSGRITPLMPKTNTGPADATSNTLSFLTDIAGNNPFSTQAIPFVFNGTTWDRDRSAGIGNNVVATGIAAASPYGQFNTTLPSVSTGNYTALQTDSGGRLIVTPDSSAASSILDGRQTFTSTTSATTLITVSVGKTWRGTIGMNVDCQTGGGVATACKANATLTTTGAGVTPAAGTYMVCEAVSGANVAAGLTGDQATNFCASSDFEVSCASGTCTVAIASTNAGTASLVDVFAHGRQQ